MQKKVDNGWSCNKECKTNCCSRVVLDVPDVQCLGMWREYRMMLVSKDYTDWDWLSYHPGIITEKQPDKRRLIKLSKGVVSELVQNPFSNVWFVFVSIPCKFLRGNNCSIYSRRPRLCRVASCLWNSKDKSLEWVNSYKKSIEVKK